MSSNSDEIQCRKLLMDFYSSEINSHSRLIIGFAVLMLTLIQVRQNFMVYSLTTSCWQYLIVYSGIFLIALALLYSLFRLFAYGAAANAIMYVEWTEQMTVGQLAFETANLVERERKKIVGIIHPKHFLRYHENGFILCAVLASVTTWLVYMLIN